MDETFHLRTYYRNFALIGIFCSILITAAASLWIALTDAAENEPPFVIFFPLFPLLFFGGLSSWILLTYLRASLTLRNGEVLQKGVFRHNRIDLRNVEGLHWRGHNSVALRSGADRLKIELEHFTVEQRLRIIRHLRENVQHSVQSHWAIFCHSVALPLATRDRPARPELGDFLFTRGRWDRLLVPFIVCSIVLAALGWWFLDYRRGLLLPVQVTALWLLMRFTTPRKGILYRGTSLPESASRYASFAFTWALVGIAIMFGTIVFGAIESMTALIGLALIGVAWFSGFVWLLHLEDLQRRRQVEEQAPDSVKEWERIFPSAHS